VQLKWTDLADTDLEKIEALIAQENSPIVAIVVVMNIIDSTHLILPDHPRAGRQGRMKNTRELVIDGVPFIVIYRENISTNCIEVLRVLHDAQQ
jgi:Plasmid stabilization system protein